MRGQELDEICKITTENFNLRRDNGKLHIRIALLERMIESFLACTRGHFVEAYMAETWERERELAKRFEEYQRTKKEPGD